MIQVQTFTFNPFSENTYILYDESKEAVIIDPGNNTTQENQAITDFISENDLKLVSLLNTHAHIDHVFGNQFIKDTYDVKLKLHEKDIPTLKANVQVAQMYGIQPFVESEPDEFMEEGDKINFGNSELDILFVPGHAPGHVAFVSQEQKFIIGGDVLFLQSIGRTDFPGCNHQDLLDSIRHKFFPLGDDFVVHSGHGPTTTIGHEKQYNPFL